MAAKFGSSFVFLQGAVARFTACIILVSLCIQPSSVDGVARMYPLAAAQRDPTPTLRLRGGWARGHTKQRQVGVRLGRRTALHHPFTATSVRPCSGPYAISAIERFHGTEVVRQCLYQSSPRSMFTDPRTSVMRLGCRMDRWEDNSPFRFSPANSTDIVLLRAAHRGLHNLFKSLIDVGADINHRGQRWTGCPANLVGLTPLEAAAHRGHLDSVIALLAMGADTKPGPGRAAAAGGEDFWVELAKTVARRRKEVAKAEDIKGRPWTGQGRRSPGKRKTRHAKGARGGVS